MACASTSDSYFGAKRSFKATNEILFDGKSIFDQYIPSPPGKKN
jgi:hypothetical protein